MNPHYRIALLMTLVAPAVLAQPTTLDPVVVTAPRWEADWLATPAAISAFDTEAAPGSLNLGPDEALERAPGLFVQNRYNFAQGIRLSIRGFGARAGFGVRGVRVLLDGVPMTLPDGQTALEGLDMGLVERVEVIRGPASALYGNASGGVVRMTTRAVPDDPYASLELSGGQDGYRRLRLEGGGAWGPWGGVGSASRLDFDGYRDHSQARETIAYAKLRRELTGGGSLTTLLNLVDGSTEDPGGLTAAERAADRSAAAPNNRAFDAGEELNQQRLAWVWAQPLAEGELTARLFVGRRDFENRLSFRNGGQVSFLRGFGGLGLEYTRDNALLGREGRLVAGVDLEAQRDHRRRHDNLNGERGARTLDQIEKVTGLGVFAQQQLALAENWDASLGARWDQVKLEVDDEFRADGNDSGSRTLSEASYSAGLSYALAPRHRLYAQVGTAFETPTTNELANPAGGGFNSDLDPQKALNTELGLKGEWQRLRYELALFRVEVDDELIPYELAGQPGRTFYRNAGSSRRQGLELALDWFFQPDWQLSGAYTYADYEFRDFVLDGEDFGGNPLPGLPRQQLFTELAWERSDRYAALSVLAVDRRYADNAASVRVPGYAVVNLRAGLRGERGNMGWEAFFGIRNLLDKDYDANIRINAGGGRYYEPAPERHFYAGVRLSHR